MSRKLILSAILQSPWLIQPEFAFNSAGLVKRVLDGDILFEAGTPSREQHKGNEEEVVKIGCTAISPDGVTTFGSWRDPFQDALPGSTAVIGISGPIMKYDNCGDPGTKTYGALLAKARRNHNITSVLLVIDSPGGTVDGTQELATAVEQFPKPIVAMVDGLMASAAYWIGSKADKLFAMNETANIGSIGVMLSFIDVQPMWEAEGVKFHYVYADASKDKNQDFHQLREGKYDLVKKGLNKIADLFITSVKSSRPSVKETALTGKMFLAEEAIEQGLIDGIRSFDEALAEAQSLAGIERKEMGAKAPGASAQSPSTQSNHHMKKVTLTAAHAALLALCGATIAAGQDSVEVDLDALETAAAAQATALKTAQDEAAAATTRATELEERATAAEAKAEELGKQNPGSASAVKKGDDAIKGGAESFESPIDAEARQRKAALYGG